MVQNLIILYAVILDQKMTLLKPSCWNHEILKTFTIRSSVKISFHWNYWNSETH